MLVIFGRDLELTSSAAYFFCILYFVAFVALVCMLTYVFYYLLFMDAFIFIFIHIHFVFIMTFVILCLLMVQLFGIYAVYISPFFRSVGRSPKFAHRVRLGSIADEIAAPLSVACSCTAVEVWYVHTKSFLLYLFRDDSYGGRGRSSFVCDVLADFVGLPLLQSSLAMSPSPCLSTFPRSSYHPRSCLAS